MSRHAFELSRGTAIAAAAALVVAGALGMRAWVHLSAPVASPSPSPAPAAAAAPAPARAADAAPAAAIAIELTADAVSRAAIRVAPAGTASAAAALTAPAVVAPNAYRQIVVTPLLSGRVTRVSAELGQHVRRGDVLATVQSAELAEATARLQAAEATLAAHDRERQRTEKLAGIGAASRQEVERIHAEHAAQVAEVESARARLEVLGGSPAAPGAERAAATARAEVRAPLDGTVMARAANIGVNVDADTALFTVADLSTVWIVSEVYERDLGRIRLGDAATVSLAAFPDRQLAGTVSYVDPQVEPATRTARLRIELANPDRILRPGMYATVALEPTGPRAGGAVPVVPRSALQVIGDRTVVYVAGPAPGRFVEREVDVAPAAGDAVAVRSGLQPGERVVTDGSFFLRAEIDRRGLRPATPAAASRPDGSEQVAVVKVVPSGFEPSQLAVRPGVPLRLRFRRTTESTCATEVVVPSLKVRRALPLDEDVEIRFTPTAGEIAFACGMDMHGGTIVAR